MIYKVDLINEVVLLIDREAQVVDAFKADGITEHHSEAPVARYTYRGLITPPGYCCVCGCQTDELHSPCSSAGGFHAFVGMAGEPGFPEQHMAENRSVPLARIHYDEITFFVEPDNLFPVEEIVQPMNV